MGLEEHIKAGAQLTRDTIVLNAPTGSGSFDLGPAFAILRIQTDNAVRLRLYDREESRDNAAEINRPFGIGISPDIALIADFSMSAAGTYPIAPAVFGFCSSSTSSQTFYRIENATGQQVDSIIRITRFLMQDESVPPLGGTFYVTDNRRVVSIDNSATNLSSSADFGASFASGVLSVGNVPQTYMMISASLANSGHKARFRLYATQSAIYSLTEISRSFTTEPSESMALLVDTLINSGSNTVFFSPKIFGANLQNMGNDLLVTALDSTKISGNSEMYYILQNLTSVPANPVVNIAVYALED